MVRLFVEDGGVWVMGMVGEAVCLIRVLERRGGEKAGVGVNGSSMMQVDC